MFAQVIKPTITLRVRRFLNEQAVDLHPWSGLDETHAKLYSLLNERKDDPAFWSPLSELLGDIIKDTTGDGRLPAAQAELLNTWDIEELIRDLRTALPGSDQPGALSSVKSFMNGLSAPVLGGFLLLGLATSSCDDTDPDSFADADSGTRADATPDTRTDTDPNSHTDADPNSHTDADPNTLVDAGSDLAWSDDCDLDSGSVIWDAIDESSLDNTDKKSLCECFEALNSDWNEGLTELFKSGSPEQVAKELEELIRCCTSSSEDFQKPYNQDVEDSIIDGTFCSGVPIYKGVSFPTQ